MMTSCISTRKKFIYIFIKFHIINLGSCAYTRSHPDIEIKYREHLVLEYV